MAGRLEAPREFAVPPVLKTAQGLPALPLAAGYRRKTPIRSRPEVMWATGCPPGERRRDWKRTWTRRLVHDLWLRSVVMLVAQATIVPGRQVAEHIHRP